MNSTAFSSSFGLPGYRILEQLYVGSRTAVYRAVPSEHEQSVIIKVLQRDYPSLGEIVQFRNQYTIVKSITEDRSIAGIVRPIELKQVGNSYALIMEDCGGISLHHYLKNYYQKPYLPLVDGLKIAIQITDILHDLYQHRVVHKDLKPANILIHPETRKIKLIDFSIASFLPKETQEIQNPNSLEGTLAYLAPEQTGRMNRGIDYRTDFYALGVTIYQLLAGTLPFPIQDPLELVHCHMAKLPDPLNQVNPDIPAMVAKIVSKLMAKNAEDRYQSALGIKHDLQECLTQWTTSNAIAPFALGQRDLSDRFSIPEKLYGREADVQILLAAFDRVAQGNTELMLVSGFSGIGKTAIINEVHKPITRQQGYFIKGKFDQFNRNVPLSAFIQAFRELISYMLSESDTHLSQWKRKILAALGDSGQILVEVIPELEQIIGQQPVAPELSGLAAQNRFNFLFQKFISIFTTPDHPLVIFLDDLQWADSASLQLIQVLTNDNHNSGHLLILGAYRDHEVSPMHPLMLTLEDLRNTELVIHTIELQPLTISHVNQLVADTLNCSPSLTLPLAELINRKTQGNPFFTTQFLKVLHDEGYITFNQDHRYWECDIAQVNILALTDDIVSFMAQQIQKLPAPTQQTLKLAACIGNRFDLATLAIISEQSPVEVATVLWKALEEGLILPISQVYKFFQIEEIQISEHQNIANPSYRFLHDRVQQAAYFLITPDQKQITHLAIGQLLKANLSESEQAEKLFDIVEHLNLGQALLTQPKDRESLAWDNLTAAQKAKSATAYAAARNFVQNGLNLVTSNCWEDQYDLSLQLYVMATETAYLNGDFDDMNRSAQQVLQSAKTALDKVDVYITRINALAAQNQIAQSITVGADALTELGIDFSEQADDPAIARALQDLAPQLQGQDVEQLIRLPAMTRPEIIAAMKLLAMLFTPIYMVNPGLFTLLCCRMTDLSLKFGNTSASAIGYIGYGLVLMTAYDDVKKGYSFGKLALKLLDQSKLPEYRVLTLLFFSIFIQHRQESLRSTIPLLKEGYLLGMEVGDFLYVGYNLNNYFYSHFFSGLCLTEWEPYLNQYCHVLAQAKQHNPETYLRMQQQVLYSLTLVTNQPDQLTGDAYDEAIAFPQYIQNNELIALGWAYIFKLKLAYLFGNYVHALNYIHHAQSNLHAIKGFVHVAVFHFYAGLTYCAIATNQSEPERLDTIAQAEQHQAALSQWAQHAPMNYQHKVDLLEAEKSRLQGEYYQAGDHYDRAIEGAKNHEFLQEEALANELAAKFYLERGKEKIAAGYMQEAYYAYTRWGATAKVQSLEQHYAQLLKPILQPVTQALAFNPLETLASAASISHISQATQDASSSSLATRLDLVAVLKASQSIASSIRLDELLQQLTQIILQYSGGDRCVLIMPDVDNRWQVRAIATSDATELCTDALEENIHVPVQLIQYVKNRQETVVTHHGQIPLPIADTYLAQYEPKSILCLPILNQAQLVGIFYLQNQNTSGVFVDDRLTVLNFLCAQAAISLENARLYQQSQAYSQQLQQSQLQIIQSEKMASLGNLVAGVAHEINNPLGFLMGSVRHLQDSLQDLWEHVALYQEQYPDPIAAIQDHAETIELEFLRDDLPHVLASMKGAADRIQGISNSLRTFSRADTAHRVSANLHDGLDSTLLILKYRLKANERRPAIQVTRDYAEIPEVDCFLGQLNQVFMNILANAIDMFDEMALSQTSEQLMANPQHITVRTTVDRDRVKIAIRDNGKGMSQTVQSQIFDHAFTTKAVGKGTGLGLAIAHQIVVEKHGGELHVQSELGQGTEFVISLPISAKPR